jgi:hypothetical protein
MRPRVLLAALLLSMALACARREPTVADVVRGSGLRFLPRDTAGVAVIEAARIEDRDALARWLGEAAQGLAPEAGLAPLRALMGGDLMKKVDRIAMALVPESAMPAGWAALVEGRFDPATLSGGDGIVPLVEIVSGPGISLTALPGGAVAIGPRAVLERIRAAAGRPQESFATAPLMSILAAVSPAAHAWGAIDYAPLADFTAGALRGSGSSLALPAPRSAGALRGVAFEGRFAAEVGFTLVGVADAEPGAKQLADGARGLVALARMGASQGNDRAWLGFLDGLRIDQAGAEVRIRGTVSRPMLRALAARVTAPGAAREADPSGAAADAVPGAPGSAAAPASPR